MEHSENTTRKLPVSQRAEKLLKEEAGERRKEVLDLATRLASTDSRVVRAKHLRKALDELEIGEAGTRNYTKVAGGIMLGASIESLIAMLAAGHFTPVGGTATCLLMGVGGFMFALGLRR